MTCQIRDRQRVICALLLLTISTVVLVLGGSHGGARAAELRDRTLTGTVFVKHGDNFASHRNTVEYSLQTTSGLVPIAPGRAAFELARLSVTLPRRAVRRAAGTPQQRSVAVLIIGEANTPPPLSRAQAEQGMAAVNAFWSEQSYGTITFASQVFGPYTASPGVNACPDDDWMRFARTAAASAGVNLNPFQHVVVIFPKSNCGYSAAAYVKSRFVSGQGEVFINGGLNKSGTSLDGRVVAHEIGHNLGAWHASTLDCRVNGKLVALAEPIENCTDPSSNVAIEYGDPFDVMNSSDDARQMNAIHKQQVGIFDATAFRQIGRPGEYQLAPIEQSTGVRALEIPLGNGRSYVVESRQSIGTADAFAASDPVVNGVLIHITAFKPSAGPTQSLQTLLVNPYAATAASPADWINAPLRVGDTFTDTAHDVTITTVSVAPTGAVVRVGVASDVTPPAAPASLSATVARPGVVTLTWPAALDDRAVESYLIERDGTAVGTVSASENFVDLPAGRRYTYSDPGLIGARAYSYRVTTVDVGGNASPASPAATVQLPDVQAPSVPLGISVGAAENGAIRLAWKPSTDDVGVSRYRILRRGVVIATTGQISFVDRGLPVNIRELTYAIAAVDASGNASAPSAAIRVRIALQRPPALQNVTATVTTSRKRGLVVHLTGLLSTSRATCSLRIGRSAFRPCVLKAGRLDETLALVALPKPAVLIVRLKAPGRPKSDVSIPLVLAR